MSVALSLATSERRSPHPAGTAVIARSHLQRILSRFGERSSVLTCLALNQLPSRTPTLFAPFTRWMPAASSGLRRPVSAASYASRRTAASRRFMVDGREPTRLQLKPVPKHDRFVEG